MGGNARTGFWRFYSVVKEPLEARADPSDSDRNSASTGRLAPVPACPRGA